MKPDVTLRPWRPADQEATRALILQGLGDHFGVIRPEFNPDLDDIQAAYLVRGAQFVVAEHAGRLVGTGALVAEGEGTGRIVRVSVDRARRRQGIGHQIVAHLIDAARAAGYHTLLVETNDDWHAAIALYRAFGFATEDVRNGEIHMRRAL